MRKIVFVALLLIFFLYGNAGNPVIRVWPDLAPGETDARPEVLEEKIENGVLRLTEVTTPTLTVFLPEGKGNGAGVIVCPGGGYGILAFDKEGTEIAQWLAKQGFTAFVLAYRVPDRQLGALQDLQRSLRLVRSRYPELKQVGTVGFSAGGSLAARAGCRLGERLYPILDRVDSLSCRSDFAVLIYPAYLDQGPGRTLTPELTLTDQTPPMFVFATADDYYGNSALVMTQALRDRKIPVELHFVARGGHGYGMRAGAGLVWPPLAEVWLKEQIKNH